MQARDVASLRPVWLNTQKRSAALRQIHRDLVQRGTDLWLRMVGFGGLDRARPLEVPGTWRVRQRCSICHAAETRTGRNFVAVLMSGGLVWVAPQKVTFPNPSPPSPAYRLFPQDPEDQTKGQ